MKTFGKILICIIVIILAVATAYSITTSKKEINSNTLNSNNNQEENQPSTPIYENKDYIGEEEKNSELPKNEEEPKEEPKKESETEELVGKDKAIDIVKKQYATSGQTVKFDHLEGEDYIIKVNEGTAITWYIVNGTTWEATEY